MWRRPAPVRSRTARSIESRSANSLEAPAHFARQLGDGHLGGVESEHVLEDRRLGCRVLAGGGSGVVHLVHGSRHCPTSSDGRDGFLPLPGAI